MTAHNASGVFDALLIQQFLEFAGLEHLDRDVTAADQLALHEQLREGGPVGIARQVGTHLGLGQHVHVAELDSQRLQHLGGPRRKAALREIGGALHEQHHRPALDLGLDALHHVHLGLQSPRRAGYQLDFTSMSSTTSFTPDTLLATVTAWSRSAVVGTVPLRVTTWASVITLMSKAFKPSFAVSLVFTAVVR